MKKSPRKMDKLLSTIDAMSDVIIDSSPLAGGGFPYAGLFSFERQRALAA